MSAYKVFQATPMDYHLEPGRYETTEFTLLTARYSLVMQCDWIAKLQGELDNSVSNDLMDVENMRSALCDFYSSGDDRTGQASDINVQWKDLIDGILRATAWQGVPDEDTGTRKVALARVVSELAYKQDITKTGENLSQVNFAEATDYLDGGADLGSRKICGIAAKTGQLPYDHESIGQLINNTNMYQILLQMRAHGCFIQDDDQKDDHTFVVNPVVEESTNLSLKHI